MAVAPNVFSVPILLPFGGEGRSPQEMTEGERRMQMVMTVSDAANGSGTLEGHSDTLWTQKAIRVMSLIRSLRGESFYFYYSVCLTCVQTNHNQRWSGCGSKLRMDHSTHYDWALV